MKSERIAEIALGILAASMLIGVCVFIILDIRQDYKLDREFEDITATRIGMTYERFTEYCGDETLLLQKVKIHGHIHVVLKQADWFQCILKK